MKYVKEYLSQYKNLEKFYIECVDKKAELMSQLPLLGGVRNKSAQNIIWAITAVVEPFISIIIVSVELPIFLFLSLFIKNEIVGEYLGLCYHGLLKNRLNATNLYDKIDCFIYQLNCPKHWRVSGKRSISLFSKLYPLEILYSYFLSILCIVLATWRNKGKIIGRNFISFEYILTAIFLNKISDNTIIVFANQIDRWAILFDNAPQITKILVQHGIESPKANWPVKLSNVTKAYVFSEKEYYYLKKAILINDVNHELMKPTIDLTLIENTSARSVLIVVGENYSFYSNEEKIITALAGKDTMIYLKIHPGKNDVTKYELLKSINPNIGIIQEPIFPLVNMVVSYRSTLGVEYDMHHIPVLYYYEYDINDIISKLLSL